MEKILFEIEKQLESDKKSVQIVEPLFYDIRKKSRYSGREIL